MQRIRSIDVVRGLVMVVMALDHIRDLMHVHSLTQNPTDLATTNSALFFTRWITHFCAPIFVFLAGTSVYLVLKKHQNLAETRRFLWTRGLWLILLEFTLISFGIWFDIHFQTFFFQVIAAIGCGFLILSLLLTVNATTLGIIGIAILLSHNLVPFIPFEKQSVIQAIIAPLFGLKVYPISPNLIFIVGYPLVPWFGIMLVGFASGKFFEYEEGKRKRLFQIVGVCALALFVGLRFLNVYGDPVAWAAQKDLLFTVLSFLNISKYPPSLMFCLTTLGGMFLLLSFVENWKSPLAKILQVYGSVPLFYYIIHWYIVHTLMLIMVFLQGNTWANLTFGVLKFGRPETGGGLELASIYAVWLAVVASLYPLCKWYSTYKANHKENRWLRYI